MRASALSRTILTVALLLTKTLLAQAPDATFAYGRDYTFERVYVPREVHDQYDHGTIQLAVWVFKPRRNDRHQVVLYSHGSIGGQVVAPQQPWEPEAPLIEYFVSRGYTYVVVNRRGIGESTGTYIEECPYFPGDCTLAENTKRGKEGLESAVLDTSTVIDKLVLGKLAPAESKIIFVGQSRGGLLSIEMAARRPEITGGAVNFVGGWLSISDKWPAQENEERRKWSLDLFARDGRKVKVPSIWIYAEGDPNYIKGTTEAFFSAFTASGAKAEYHIGGKVHGLTWYPEGWTAFLDHYMQQLEAAEASAKSN